MQRLAILAVLLLAGCADTTPAGADEGPGVGATGTTGGIRGVVVDASINPVAAATVKIVSTDLLTTSDENGEFLFTGLEPGTYFIAVSKIGHETVQTSALVDAGVLHPPMVTVQLPRIVGLNPSLATVVFDGYYECAFALFFITDQCDFVVRTVHDETGVGPRTVQNNLNTAFYPLEEDVQTVIIEGFFDNGAVSKLRFGIHDTPIDNACDCSDTFVAVITDTGYGLARVDAAKGPFPSTERDFAVRAFLPFTEATEVSYAADFSFQVFTTKFHGYQAPEGWNFLEADDFPKP